MNCSYRLVWNRATGVMQVVSELAKSHGGGRGGSGKRGLMLGAVAVLLAEAAQPVWAASQTETSRIAVSGSYTALASNGGTLIYSVPAMNAIATGGSNGGAIYVGAGASLSATTDASAGAVLQFSGNTAPYGGAVDVDGGTATIANTTFTSNNGVHGGGIFNSSLGTSTIHGSAFSANVADFGAGVDSDGISLINGSGFSNNKANKFGGGLYNSGNSTLSNNTFANNSAAVYGGAIYNTDTGTFHSTADAYTANTAAGDGGAIWSGNGTGVITTATLQNNNAGSNGGAIENTNHATLTVSASNFNGNGAGGYGGAIDNRNGSATINASGFSANQAKYGGAIANYTQSAATTLTLTLTDSNFQQNTANYGGAIYNFASALNLNVSAGATSTFSGNTADFGSGAYRASSLYFEGGGSLNVTVDAGGLLDLRDPMAGVLGASALSLNKNGAGIWALGGANVFAGSGAATTFNVNAGTLYLDGAGEKSNASSLGGAATVVAASIQLDGSASRFALGQGATLVAAGDNSISTAGTISLADGATLRGGTAADANGDTRSSLGGATALSLSANGGVVMQGALTLNSPTGGDRFTLNANLADDTAGGHVGSVIVNGAGSVILTGANTYSGATMVEAGVLAAGAQHTFSANSQFNIGQHATLALDGHNQTVAGVNNAGSVTLGGATAGAVLTVNGNYTGSNGVLLFNAVLGGDNSAADKLVVNGDTSGTTRVGVNNLGGSGAATLDGIELIHVQGASAGEFVQTGRIAAGAYDYRLARGIGADSGNWFLSAAAGASTSAPTPGQPTLRPEAGAYTANLAAANTLFNTGHDDRLGETAYVDAITGEKKLTSLWMRATGGHGRARDGSGQLGTKSDHYTIVLGGDLAGGLAKGDGAWRLGLLAGYGNDSNRSSSNVTGYTAKGNVDGYTTGLYGTWYASGTDQAGLYIDSVLQYDWFKNSVNGDGLAGERYHSKGLQAALETGYVLTLAQLEHGAVRLEPKARLAWSGIRAHDHTESNGTRVSASGENNVATSLGVKASWKKDAGATTGDGEFQPFIETNWVHNTQAYGVRMDSVEVARAGMRNVVEMKFGVDGDLTPRLKMTALIAQQLGKDSYSDISAFAGIKYSF